MDKKFKIIVFVKQVPDTDDIKWTENNTIQREGLDSIINPYDLSALQTAVEIKKYRIKNAEIVAVSMGPKQAEQALKQALALGADRAYLLSDRKFSAAEKPFGAYISIIIMRSNILLALRGVCQAICYIKIYKYIRARRKVTFTAESAPERGENNGENSRHA